MITHFLRFLLALLCSCLFIFVKDSHAQITGDTLHLDEIEVVATRIQQPLQHQPTDIQVIDSTLLRLQSALNLGEVLSSSSTLFIRDNGPGGLATVSQRGLSAEETQVLWEGIPINNIMLGQSDLSLLPASLFSSVQISSGNPSSAFGGGSLAGAIYLSSDFQQGNNVSLRQGAGSFGQWQTSLNGRYQSGGWSIGVQSSLSRSENDFEYFNQTFDRFENREHNRQEQENVLTQVGYQDGIKKFETKLWFSNSNNEIPGNVFQTNSQARQDDNAVRWLSKYQTRWQGAKITFKNYLDRVELNFFDPQADIRSLSTFRRWLGSAVLNYDVTNRFLVKGELSAGLSGVETSNYTGLQTRQQFSALVNPELYFINDKLKIYPALRFDSYNDFGSVLSPSLGLNYDLLYNKLYLRGQVSRDFNPPTFNALYFVPGGDPSLKAERGNKAESGLVFNPRWATFSTVKLTGFYHVVSDGIRFFANDDGVFTAENVDEITSKGFEANLQNRLQIANRWAISFNQSVIYTHAKITEPRFSGDNAVGNQLRYVPKWNYQSSLRVTRGIITGLLQYRWTGRRFVTATEDLNNSLDPYQLLNGTLQIRKHFGGVNFTARAGVRNLLNSDYEIIQRFPLPRRNYQFSLTATYKF